MFETEIENTNSLSTELSTKQDRTVEAYRLVTDVRLNIGERSVLEPIRPYRGGSTVIIILFGGRPK